MLVACLLSRHAELAPDVAINSSDFEVVLSKFIGSLINMSENPPMSSQPETAKYTPGRGGRQGGSAQGPPQIPVNV